MPMVIDTINNLKNVITLDNVLIHSDQEFHYTDPECIIIIKKNNVIQSMSKKVNFIDNAPMEGFFGHFKDEVDYKSCKTFEEFVKKLINTFIITIMKGTQRNKLKRAPAQYRNHC